MIFQRKRCSNCHTNGQVYQQNLYFKDNYKFSLSGQALPLLCPQCQNEGIDDTNAIIDFDYFSDKVVKRRMGKLSVICANKECTWKGLFLDYPQHERECLKTEVQKLSQGLRMLETENENHLISSESAGDPSNFDRTQSISSDESSISQLTRKMDLCNRKMETYEGIAMVLNVSFDRLLNQVTEIDHQRRREKEYAEAQEKKIQVGLIGKKIKS